jgi:glycosyltransferase 2 family protein
MIRKIVLTALKVAVSIALLYLALRGVDLSVVLAKLRLLDIGWTVAAITAAFLQQVVAAIRWQRIAAVCDVTVSAGDAIRFQFTAAFFNQALPSTIGGDGIRVWLLQRQGASWRAATYSVLVDRAIGLIVLGAMVITSLYWSVQLITSIEGRLALIFIDCCAVLSGAAFLALAAVPSRRLERWFVSRHIMACSKIANRVLFGRETGPMVLLASATGHALTAVIAWCLGRAILAPVAFHEIFLIMLPVALIMVVPISIAGWGVREQSMQLAFSYANLSAADGLTVSLLFGLASLFVGLLGGIVWLLSREFTEKAQASP